ncbi:MMPL family transporter [Mycoplasmatota bacterium WC44]
MKPYVTFINKFKKPLFLLFFLLNIISIFGITKLNISTDFTIFMPNESVHKEYLDEMNSYFKSDEQMIFMIDYNEINIENLESIFILDDYLSSFTSIEFLNSPALEVLYIDGEIDETDVVNFENYLKSLNELSPVIEKDGKYHAMFVAFINEEFNNDDLTSIREYLSDNDYRYSISGNKYSEMEILNFIIKIVIIFPPLALLLILFVFRLQMRSMNATLLSVLPAGIGSLWTMGLLGLLGNELSLVTVLAPIFTIVIGSADGLHFMSHMQESEEEGNSRFDSTVKTLKMVGIPMIITTITSVFGFLSLIAMKSDSIMALATSASIGITFAGIATWYILPLLLSNNIDISIKSISRRNRDLSSYLKKLWGKRIVILTVALLAGSLFISQYIKSEFNMLMIYKDNTEIQQNFKQITAINDGSLPLYVYFKTDDDILGRNSYLFAEELSNKLLKSNAVFRVNNGYSMIQLVNEKMSGNHEYPENEMIAKNIFNVLTKPGAGVPITEFISTNDKVFKIMIFPKNQSNETLTEIEKIVVDSSNTDYTAKVTGVQYVMKDLNDVIIKSQIITVLLAIAFVFILLLISMKSFILALISLVPIASTTVMLFGFLAVTGISLNVVTATMFSISIGVGIDYAVHFSSIFKELKKDSEVDDAIESTFKYCSRPIIANATGIAIGLSVLILSPLTIHTYLSSLMWFSMIICLVLSLSLLPTILKWYYKNI